MSRTKKVIQPNYEIMLKSHISNVQNAYSEYKKAMSDYLRYSFIGSDGSYCYSPSCMEKVHEKLEEYNKAMKELNEFKTFMEVNKKIIE